MNDKNYDEIKDISKKLKSEINNLRSSLAKFETSVALIENGDNKGPYWNGSNAYYCIDKSLMQIDYNYNLIDNIEKCIEFLDNIQE